MTATTTARKWKMTAKTKKEKVVAAASIDNGGQIATANDGDGW